MTDLLTVDARLSAIIDLVEKFRDDPTNRITQLNSPDGTPIGLLPLSVFWPQWVELETAVRPLLDELVRVTAAYEAQSALLASPPAAQGTPIAQKADQ